ncbi:MAG: hypothetical protein ACR2ML_13760 [Solirubrobacteraceae bacterium]
MARLSPQQLTTRRRIERLIRLLAPGLDVVLAAGDRISRLSGPDPADEYSSRPLTADDSRRVTPIGR